jgi:hypothetical protein
MGVNTVCENKINEHKEKPKGVVWVNGFILNMLVFIWNL